MATISDVRAVLSRAKTTRDELVWDTYEGNIYWGMTDWLDLCKRRGWAGADRPIPAWFPTAPTGVAPDPTSVSMVEALDVVIDVLQPYENPRRPWKARVW